MDLGYREEYEVGFEERGVEVGEGKSNGESGRERNNMG